IAEFAAQVADVAAAKNQRRMLLVSGSASWGQDGAAAVTEKLASDQLLWVSNQPPDNVPAIRLNQSTQVLGGERHVVVYDAHNGFDADALGAVSGLVCGGGLLLLLVPSLAEWPTQPDSEASRFMSEFEGCGYSYFIERLGRVLTKGEGVSVVKEHASLPVLEVTAGSADARRPVDKAQALYATGDQRLAVEAVIGTATGGAACSSVLVSDRGRGKSAALGIAAAQLLKQGISRVVVTAPRLSAVNSVFDHAHRLLPDAHYSRGSLHYHSSVLQFVAPDELIGGDDAVDVLLVDEAAAIPTPMLTRLLRRYSRIVFSTTVHGYEGSGRGFALRFNKILNAERPGWQCVRMETPVRWAAHDPVEKLLFDALLLDSNIASNEELKNNSNYAPITERLSGKQLVKDESILAQLFGLLVLAHYRTRPNDLRQLLDSQEVSVYVMRQGNAVIGTTLLVNEGGFGDALAQAVYRGERRLRGHLAPQTLAAYVGMPEAATLKYARVMRVAIHPALQRQGYGSQLLKHVFTDCEGRGFDLAAASFGATNGLLAFWAGLGFSAVRMGLKREHSSGTHSVVMLKPLTEAGEKVNQGALARLHKRLPYLLKDQLKDVDSDVAEKLILATSEVNDIELHEYEQKDLWIFAQANLGVETVIPQLHELATNYFSGGSDTNLEEKESAFLKAKILSQKNWSQACKESGISGKKEALALLRNIVLKLIS
ncbi:tRNA(Met) cytidine acetyltransferase TmcA, partial [Pseudomonadota bacterium]